MLNHSEDQVVHGLFPKKVTDAVLSNHEKHSMLLIEDEETGGQFVLLTTQAVDEEVEP
ncbi:hypothetical protein K7H08_07390 [Halomonas sp. IOP_6]|uniref:hypothetical protein n=1 Tax=Halomonas sp. IOP_6 TaxID=2876583 RepID=UPI001E46130C|nr:hypothetical protein [Halomonas sp. IOP_6]MCD6004654.1 hypothetical protein [Halomonas sp. IOP_6]